MLKKGTTETIEEYFNAVHNEEKKCCVEKFLSFFFLPSQVPIRLSTVGFVPLYGGEEKHKVLALFSPEDSLTGFTFKFLFPYCSFLYLTVAFS